MCCEQSLPTSEVCPVEGDLLAALLNEWMVQAWIEVWGLLDHIDSDECDEALDPMRLLFTLIEEDEDDERSTASW